MKRVDLLLKMAIALVILPVTVKCYSLKIPAKVFPKAFDDTETIRHKRGDEPEFKKVPKLSIPTVRQATRYGCGPTVAEIILRYLGGTSQTLFGNASIPVAHYQLHIGRQMQTSQFNDPQTLTSAGTTIYNFVRELNNYSSRMGRGPQLYRPFVLVPIEFNPTRFYNIVYDSLTNNVPVAFGYRGSAGPQTRTVNGQIISYDQVPASLDEQHFILIIGITSDRVRPSRAIDVAYDCWDPDRGFITIAASQLPFYITASDQLSRGSYLVAYSSLRSIGPQYDINTYFPIRNFRFNFPAADLASFQAQPSRIVDALVSVNNLYVPTEETNARIARALLSDIRVRNVTFDRDRRLTAEIYTRSDGLLHGSFFTEITPQMYNPSNPIDINSLPLNREFRIDAQLATERTVRQTFLLLNYEYLHPFPFENFYVSDVRDGRAKISVRHIPSLRGSVEVIFNKSERSSNSGTKSNTRDPSDLKKHK